MSLLCDWPLLSEIEAFNTNCSHHSCVRVHAPNSLSSGLWRHAAAWSGSPACTRLEVLPVKRPGVRPDTKIGLQLPLKCLLACSHRALCVCQDGRCNLQYRSLSRVWVLLGLQRTPRLTMHVLTYTPYLKK